MLEAIDSVGTILAVIFFVSLAITVWSAVSKAARKNIEEEKKDKKN